MTAPRTRKASNKSDVPATPSPSPDEVIGDPEPEQQAEAEVAATEAEAAPAPEVKEADSESDAEPVTIRYEGHADGIEHGPFRFRPGQQVLVPSDVAEELLTWPHERFVKVVSQE